MSQLQSRLPLWSWLYLSALLDWVNAHLHIPTSFTSLSTLARLRWYHKCGISWGGHTAFPKWPGFCHLFLLPRPEFLSEYPLPFRFYHQRYQQVVEKPLKRPFKIQEKSHYYSVSVITCRLLSTPATKHSAIFDDIKWYSLNRNAVLNMTKQCMQ